jgi:PST family polysaccharide transporter
MGLGAGLALVGKDLMLVILGPRWDESGRIFTFFAPGIGAMLLYLAYGWIHLSLGRADRLLRWGIIEFTVIGLLFVGGLRRGPVGIAMAWVVSSWALAIPALWYAGRPAALRIGAIVRAVWRYVVASALAGGTAAMIVRRMPSLVSAPGWVGAMDRSLTVSVLFAALYLGAVILLHGGCDPLRQIAALVGDMLPQRDRPGRGGVLRPGATAMGISG